jgi:hypothetical protein
VVCYMLKYGLVIFLQIVIGPRKNILKFFEEKSVLFNFLDGTTSTQIYAF